MSTPAVLARSRFQVFAFEVPRLRVAELETSLRHRVRSMTPLHDGHYRLWFHRERNAGMDRAYVFVTRPDQGPFRPEFPVRVPAGAPKDCIVTLATSEGPLALLYRQGFLSEVAPAGAAVPDRWDSPQRLAATNWGKPPAPLPALRAEPFPWLPLLVLSAALLVVAGGLVAHWRAKVERNSTWKTWIETQAAVKKPVAADLEALKKAAGLPLDDVFTQLATAWPRGVLIRNLHVDGWKIDLEADSESGLGSFQSLTAQPGFRRFLLSGVRSQPDGHERLSAQGVWSDGR